MKKREKEETEEEGERKTERHQGVESNQWLQQTYVIEKQTMKTP